MKCPPKGGPRTSPNNSNGKPRPTVKTTKKNPCDVK